MAQEAIGGGLDTERSTKRMSKRACRACSVVRAWGRIRTWIPNTSIAAGVAPMEAAPRYGFTAAVVSVLATSIPFEQEGGVSEKAMA